MSFHLSVIEETDALLIEKIRLTSILYNNHYADFRHSHKKDKAWEDVANSLGISKSDAKRRWTCLRDRYTRELKEVRSKCPRKEDVGTGEFFQIMDFLRPFVRKRRPNKPKLEGSVKSEVSSAKKVKLDEIETDFQSEECTEDQYEKVNTDEYNYIACEYPIETYEEFAEVQENSSSELIVSDQCHKSTKNSLIPIIFPSGTINSTSIDQQQTSTEQQPQQPIHNQASSSQHTQQQMENNDLKQKEKETEDDFFCKSVAIYLRKLSRLHKIKAKVEMFQILEKYIEMEESTTHILPS